MADICHIDTTYFMTHFVQQCAIMNVVESNTYFPWPCALHLQDSCIQLLYKDDFTKRFMSPKKRER